MTLNPGRWYRLTMGIANEGQAFRISGQIEDFGTDGLQFVSVLSQGSYFNPDVNSLMLNTVDSALAADTSTYFSINGVRDTGVTRFDTFEFTGGQVPEANLALLLASGTVFMTTRRSRRS
jgi:hypothetical protein